MTILQRAWKVVQPKPVNWDFIGNTMANFAISNTFRSVWNLTVFCMGASFALTFDPTNLRAMEAGLALVFTMIFAADTVFSFVVHEVIKGIEMSDDEDEGDK